VTDELINRGDDRKKECRDLVAIPDRGFLIELECVYDQG